MIEVYMIQKLQRLTVLLLITGLTAASLHAQNFTDEKNSEIEEEAEKAKKEAEDEAVGQAEGMFDSAKAAMSGSVFVAYGLPAAGDIYDTDYQNSDVTEGGLAGGAQLMYSLSPQLAAGGYIGYRQLLKVTTTSSTVEVTTIPVVAKLRFYPVQNFFLTAGVGPSFTKQTGTSGGDFTDIAADFGLGFDYAVAEGFTVTPFVEYNMIFVSSSTVNSRKEDTIGLLSGGIGFAKSF